MNQDAPAQSQLPPAEWSAAWAMWHHQRQQWEAAGAVTTDHTSVARDTAAVPWQRGQTTSENDERQSTDQPTVDEAVLGEDEALLDDYSFAVRQFLDGAICDANDGDDEAAVASPDPDRWRVQERVVDKKLQMTQDAQCSSTELQWPHTVITRCIRSLYRDRCAPTANRIGQRLQEAGMCSKVTDSVLAICHSAAARGLYRVTSKDNEDPLICLSDQPLWFEGWIDARLMEDCYDADTWEAFTAFIHALASKHSKLPTSAYAAAQEIRQSHVTGLQSLALGELEHMVILAQARGRRLLRTERDGLRPCKVVRRVKAKRTNISLCTEDNMEDAPTNTNVLNMHLAGASEVESACLVLELMRRFPHGAAWSTVKEQMQVIDMQTSVSDFGKKGLWLSDVLRCEVERQILFNYAVGIPAPVAALALEELPAKIRLGGSEIRSRAVPTSTEPDAIILQ